MIEAGCLVINTLLYSKTTFPNVTTWSFCLLPTVKTGSTVTVFASKKWVFDPRDSSSHSANEWSSPDASEPMLHSTGVSSNVSNSFLASFWHPGQYPGDWNFLLMCQSCHFLVWVVFEFRFDDFLANNLRPSWSSTILERLLNVVPSDELWFCWRSSALKSQLSCSLCIKKWIL